VESKKKINQKDLPDKASGILQFGKQFLVFKQPGEINKEIFKNNSISKPKNIHKICMHTPGVGTLGAQWMMPF